MNIERIPVHAGDPEPSELGTRVEDGEGGIWERNSHGSWTGPNTVWREWHRVVRIQPVHLLVPTREIPGQADLFGGDA